MVDKILKVFPFFLCSILFLDAGVLEDKVTMLEVKVGMLETNLSITTERKAVTCYVDIIDGKENITCPTTETIY